MRTGNWIPFGIFLTFAAPHFVKNLQTLLWMNIFFAISLFQFSICKKIVQIVITRCSLNVWIWYDVIRNVFACEEAILFVASSQKGHIATLSYISWHWRPYLVSHKINASVENDDDDDGMHTSCLSSFAYAHRVSITFHFALSGKHMWPNGAGQSKQIGIWFVGFDGDIGSFVYTECRVFVCACMLPIHYSLSFSLSLLA